MRILTDHIVTGDQAAQLSIEVTDQPGQGSANHKYEITGFDTAGNASKTGETGYSHEFSRLVVLFQNGPIKEFGVNGVTQEALLVIVIDRLRGFQRGPFRCEDNEVALAHCCAALTTLQKRTVQRIARGVEGTNQK